MDRAIGGFITGFFLAAFLLSAAIYTQVSPLQDEISTAVSTAHVIYGITHGPLYSQIIGFADWANSTAASISQTPFLGALVPSNVPDTVSQLNLLVENSKEFSENLLSALQFLQLLAQASFPAMVASLVLTIIGAFLLITSKPGR